MSNHITILEIDEKAVLYNLNYFKQKLKPKTKILVVVKAFGYGSDAVEIAKIVQNEVDYFAVAYSSEGIVLRNAGIKTPILVLHPQIQNIQEIVKYKLEPNLYSFKIINAFLQFASNEGVNDYPVHIKFNTGLNRLGFNEDDVKKITLKFEGNSSVKIKSILSHLAASEDFNEKEFTLNQINKYNNIVKELTLLLGYKPITHILNTSGIINYNYTDFDMVRMGIGLYGFGNQSEITEQLKNVLTLKSVISQIHLIPAGETIGYNRAFVSDKDVKIAIVPIGHADGISRKLGNKNGFVTINNKKAYIIGNVCMDIIMVDITDINCNEGDEVIIFSSQNEINYIADKCETIPYEILTALSQRIKRVVKK